MIVIGSFHMQLAAFGPRRRHRWDRSLHYHHRLRFRCGVKRKRARNCSKIAAITNAINFIIILSTGVYLPQFLKHQKSRSEVDKSDDRGELVQRKSHGRCVWVVDLVRSLSGTHASYHTKILKNDGFFCLRSKNVLPLALSNKIMSNAKELWLTTWKTSQYILLVHSEFCSLPHEIRPWWEVPTYCIVPSMATTIVRAWCQRVGKSGRSWGRESSQAKSRVLQQQTGPAPWGEINS